MSNILADANPDKNFFVEAITKDITLLDCVLDLIDNSIDSATSGLGAGDILTKPGCLSRYKIDIEFDESQFSIEDNAHGISLERAKTSVFRFGSIKKEQTESIGYYGIGLKRASFKIGKDIVVWSTTPTESFAVNIKIEEWLKKLEWNFPIDLEEENRNNTDTGVIIEIKKLYPEISQSFGAPIFKEKLMETIGRDYYFFLKAGLAVAINGDPVQIAELEIKNSDQFAVGFDEYTEDGVHIKMLTGCHSKFEDADTQDAENFDPKVSGWYVICNNRIILAANKDEKTIWRGKHENFTFWHPQYNGFVGFVFFNSNDQSKLPWTTTKRYVDLESNIYRSALLKMLEMTKPWIRYTGQRKANIEEARKVEVAAPSAPLAQLAVSTTNRSKAAFPTIQAQDQVEMSTISYKVEKFKADKCKIALANPNMSNTELGRQTFYYFLKNETE